jgi:hypothetical protein
MLLSLFLVGPYACFLIFEQNTEGQLLSPEKLRRTVPGKDIASGEIR